MIHCKWPGLICNWARPFCWILVWLLLACFVLTSAVQGMSGDQAHALGLFSLKRSLAGKLKSGLVQQADSHKPALHCWHCLDHTYSVHPRPQADTVADFCWVTRCRYDTQLPLPKMQQITTLCSSSCQALHQQNAVSCMLSLHSCCLAMRLPSDTNTQPHRVNPATGSVFTSLHHLHTHNHYYAQCSCNTAAC
jgi:hypothetical protein